MIKATSYCVAKVTLHGDICINDQASTSSMLFSDDESKQTGWAVVGGGKADLLNFITQG